MTRMSLRMFNVLLAWDQSGMKKKKKAVVAFIDHGIGAGARHMIYSVLYLTKYLEAIHQ